MSIRTSMDPYGGRTNVVDKFIGNAYPIVRAVFEKLDELTFLALNFDKLRPQEVVFRSNDATQAIEWRYADETTWTVLVKYDALLGADVPAVMSELREINAAVQAKAELIANQAEQVADDATVAALAAQNAASSQASAQGSMNQAIQSAAAAVVSQNAAAGSAQAAATSEANVASQIANLIGNPNVLQDYRIGIYEEQLRPLLNWVSNPRRISLSNNYKQAPFSARIGNSVVCIFSDGDSHGNTNRQIMCRTQDNGKTWETVVFVEYATPTVFNTSLLDGIMQPGESIVLKVYTIYRGPTTCFVYDAATQQPYQNLLTYSDDTEHASWSLGEILPFGSGSVANTTAVRDPSGNYGANLIVPTANANPHGVSKVLTGVTPNQVQSVARWYKAQPGGPGYVMLGLFDADTPANFVNARMTLANGAVAGITNGGTGTGATASMTAFPDGWYLLTVTGKPAAAGTNTMVLERPVTSTGGNYTGNGVNGYYQYRAQLQLGATLNQPLVKTEAVAVHTTGGGSNIYNWWGKCKKRGAYWYRTGYTTTPGNPGWVAGLFRSPDNMSWSLLATWAVSGKNMNEADVEQLDNGDWIAVIREDLTAGRQLYFSYSAGGDSNWTAPTEISQATVAGTQPNLTKLPNGRIMLAVGDRTGVTGISPDGVPDLVSRDRTGVSLSMAPATINAASQWEPHTQLALSWSTDCGQPMFERGIDGNLIGVMYLRPREDSETGIYSAVINSYR